MQGYSLHEISFTISLITSLMLGITGFTLKYRNRVDLAGNEHPPALCEIKELKSLLLIF